MLTSQTFTSLSDGNYKKLALDKPPIEQVVHPVATADIIGRGDDVKKHTMWSCSGDVLSVDVEASVCGLGNMANNCRVPDHSRSSIRSSGMTKPRMSLSPCPKVSRSLKCLCQML